MTDAELLALDDREFLEAAYSTILGRPIDLKGLMDGLGRLLAGGARPHLLEDLRRSPEAAARQVPGARLAQEQLTAHAADGLAATLSAHGDDFIVRAYRLVLDREPDAGGLVDLRGRLARGEPRQRLLLDLADSPEGQARGCHLPELREWQRHERRRFARLRRLWGRWFGPENLMAAALSGNATTMSPDLCAVEPHPAAGLARRPRLTASLRPPSGPQQATQHLLRVQRSARHALKKADNTMTDLRSSMQSPPSASERPLSGPDGSILIEALVGCWLSGRSTLEGAPAHCGLNLRGRLLGSIAPSAADGPESEPAGRFRALLGGVVHFAALTPGLEFGHLERLGGGETATWDFTRAWSEALSFSPMKALSRLPETEQVGRLLSAELVAGHRLLLTIETATAAEGAPGEYLIEAYQSEGDQDLVRLARHGVSLQGQILTLDFPLRDRRAPVLLVTVDTSRRIIATDCVPLPELLGEAQLPLLDYHSLLTGGQAILDVATKIGRAHLDAALRARSGTPARRFDRSRCVLLLYSREHHDFLVGPELQAAQGLAAQVAALDSSGRVVEPGGRSTSLEDHLARWADHDLLLVESRSRLRPDFWAAMDLHSFRVGPETDLVHWDSIWVDGLSRPQLVKTGLLLHPAFEGHDTIALRSALLTPQLTARLLASTLRPRLRSGALALEQLLAVLGDVDAVRVPQVMETVDLPALPAALAAIISSEHLPLPTRPTGSSTAPAAEGVSVIINYRNGAEDTIRCLTALRGQQHPAPIEVVLVNNLSSAENHRCIVKAAHELFGEAAVQTLDFPMEFNHSAQCNLAARAARHDLLLMLSNDSVLLTPDALAQAAHLARVPWVGSVGFRIIDLQRGKSKLQSLGLGLAPRQMLFHGGSPLATYRPPAPLLNHTLETLGNTFAAVMLRRELYFELGGLDEAAFPTNYNDVDFCCRALQHGYRHVTIGAAIVQHVGRGSREMDLDLPIDQRILERCPDFAKLTSVGMASL